MKNIQGPIEAKQFFISKIVEHAKRTNQPLTQLEEKMLWFTECGSDANAEYLEAAKETYLAARDALSTEDHYLLIMVKNVFGSSFRSRLSFLGMLLRTLFTSPKRVGIE